MNCLSILKKDKISVVFYRFSNILLQLYNEENLVYNIINNLKN